MFYSYSLKKKMCTEVCISGKSTSKVAEEYSVPIKTFEKWITAFRKDQSCFDSAAPNDFNFVDPINSSTPYDDLSTHQLKKQLMLKDIEIARLKKGYLVEGGGLENKVFVSFYKKNTK